jgi:hypothetical protein
MLVGLFYLNILYLVPVYQGSFDTDALWCYRYPLYTHSQNMDASEKFVKMLAKTCASLVFVNAEPLKLESLLEAGVDRCASLVVVVDGGRLGIGRQEPSEKFFL